MKIQDLTYVNPSAGRPSSLMTNETWQELFNLMKLTVKPSNQRKISTYAARSPIDSHFGTYHGDTLNQSRKKLLNDNLDQIRKGDVDYVYYIYNISELLKYEHDRLRSNYDQRGQYFKIWLEKRQ